MQISEKSIRDAAGAIVALYSRFSTSTDIAFLNAQYNESRNQLRGIYLILPLGSMANFLQSSIDGLSKLHNETVDRLNTQQIALEVDQDAFPKTGDLGRSSAFQSPVEVGQGSTHEH